MNGLRSFYLFVIFVLCLNFFIDPMALFSDKTYSSADIVSCRTYLKVRVGLYHTSSREYVEYIFYHDDELKIERDCVSEIFIGDVSTVGIETAGDKSRYRLSLTLEDYQELTAEGYWEPVLAAE